MSRHDDVAAQGRLGINPEPLEVVERRDDVTAIAALRGRSREDKLRTWLALGGTEADFPEAREEVCAMQNIKVGRYENPDAGYLGWIEPEDATWIAFVRDDHVPEVYLDRDPETGAVV
jgi:hypothetical protein